MSGPANEPVLEADGLVHRFGRRVALDGVSLALHRGEVLAVVGESGSGKSTLLACLAGRLAPSAGVVHYRDAAGARLDVHALPEARRRVLARTEWGFVAQQAEQGLRMPVSAGANIGERLMAIGWRHVGRLRAEAGAWMREVELDPARIDETPAAFSGGMRQRLQIARNLVTRPRLVVMDEPTSGLDVSVQARLLDLLRLLVARLGLSAIVVTHDLGVARLLAHRVLVMRHGQVVESGLIDRVFDDPQHPYTQLLVSSALG